MEKFNGFHKEVTKTFSRSFNGSEVEIGDVKFIITESFIEEAAERPSKVNDGSKTRNFTMKHGGRCSKHQVWISQFSRKAFLVQP